MGLSNGQVEVRFDRRNGMLIGLKNLSTGDEYLKGPGRGGNPFRAYVDTTELPPVLAVSYPYRVQPVEGTLGGRFADPHECRLVESEFERSGRAGVLRMELRHPESGLVFDLRVCLPDRDVAVQMELTVRNDGPTARHAMVAFPYLTGLCLGADRATNRGVRLRSFGQSRAPAWENQGDVYGRGWSGQWNAVYERSLNEGLGLIVKDSGVRNKVFRRFPPAGLSVLYCDRLALARGETVRYPAVDILVHRGDWKFTARRYAKWFGSAFTLRRQPAWADQIDRKAGLWVPSPEAVVKAKARGSPGHPIASFTELPWMYHHIGGGQYDLVEWAQYWQGVVTSGRYHSYHHTDGLYRPRVDLGGVEALRAGVVRLSRLGRFLGLYVASKTVRKDSPLFRDCDPTDWLLMRTPDTVASDKHESIHVCCGYELWQRHLASEIEALIRQTGARYVRLDEFGWTFEPCHNPAHDHPSPYHANAWHLRFLRRIREAMDRVDPETLLFTENACDLAHQYTNGALQLWSAGPDLAPLRLALPSFLGFAYHGGEIEAALNGYVCGIAEACNRSGWLTTHHNTIWGPGLERKPECYPDKGLGGKLRWHELAHTFVEAARHGDPTDLNPWAPSQDSEQWAARLWRSSRYWLMVCGSRAAVRPEAGVEVRLPELPKSVKRAFEFDTATLAMRDAALTRTGDLTSVTVTSGFAAVFLPLPECPALVQISEPGDLEPGGSVELGLSAFGPWRDRATPVAVAVEAPGLIVEPASLVLPGLVKVSAPAEAEPGAYSFRVTGDCLRLKRWLTLRK